MNAGLKPNVAQFCESQTPTALKDGSNHEKVMMPAAHTVGPAHARLRVSSGQGGLWAEAAWGKGWAGSPQKSEWCCPHCHWPCDPRGSLSLSELQLPPLGWKTTTLPSWMA